MYRMTVLYPPPTDPDAFVAHYTSTHLPLVARLPGLRRSEWSAGLRAVGKDKPFFAMWQGDFDDAAAMGAAMSSPEGQAVAADVPNYATGGAVVLHGPVSEGGLPES